MVPQTASKTFYTTANCKKQNHLYVVEGRNSTRHSKEVTDRVMGCAYILLTSESPHFTQAPAQIEVHSTRSVAARRLEFESGRLERSIAMWSSRRGRFVASSLDVFFGFEQSFVAGKLMLRGLVRAAGSPPLTAAAAVATHQAKKHTLIDFPTQLLDTLLTTYY